jgi:conjugal transfer/type IV secretion protein DotA/TraY
MIFTPQRVGIIKYTLLPQVVPRMRELLGRGFEFIPYMIALVYQCVRLLPPGHPYADPRNIGRFGIRNVVAEAANHLVIKLANIDQLILFGVVLVGLGLAAIQFFLLGLALFMQPAMAAMPTSFAGFFLTPEATQSQDLAHMMLDLVFGVPDMFHSCIANPSTPCKDMDGNPLQPQIAVGGDTIFGQTSWPYPIHDALHQLFTVYSLGLLVVAVIITLYFMFTVVAETAQTGTAFGKRFNKVWAPLRIVMAFGLLVPLGNGLNSAQYIVLYAAKFGTGFATNGWVLFNETLSDNYLGETKKLVATPQVPEVGALIQFMFVARTCYEADMLVNGALRTGGNVIQPYAVRDPLSANNFWTITAASNYDDLMTFLNGENVATIRFGIRDPKNYAIYKGNVSPLCGELTFMLTDSRVPGGSAGGQEPGTKALQQAYFETIKNLWFSEFGAPGAETKPYNYACKQMGVCKKPGKANLPELQVEEMAGYKDRIAQTVSTALTTAVESQEKSGRFTVDANLKEKGWPAAAIWYNRIAELNGSLTTATFKVPMPSYYPEVMEYVKAKQMQYDQEVSPQDRYKPQLANGNQVEFPDSNNKDIAKALSSAFNAWQSDGVATSAHTEVTGNIVIDVINTMFGTSGLYNMRKNTDVHPLAQLSALGKSLVDSAINNIGYAAMGAGTGGLLSVFVKFPGVAASVVADLLISFAMVGLTAGFILYYIVPFLPFIYFFFSFGGWIKAIFEAMVGTPLWALAHIRIDGDGLPGRAAMGGYFLIFEIFLRPILTVFGFIASITIFAALVETLNEIFSVVTNNVAGYDVKSEITGVTPSQIEYYRGPVDEFFYTVVYAVVVYMMAMSSFKLIDQIPNGILRWMGQSVAPFGREEDAAEGLISNSQVGLSQGLQAAGGGMRNIAQTVSTGGAAR